jgi:uncharacterized protein (DUF4415 family)
MPDPKIRPDTPDDDAPEADDAWFARARPASEALPELFGETVAAEMLKPRRGRPRSVAPKTHVNIRLDAEVVEAFKQAGPGWQTRVNQALKEWLATQR